MSDQRREPMKSRAGAGPGTRLNGIYEIERLIAVGGMGEVYKGRAIQTGDAVAIKTIRPEMAENESALMLFRKEAAALHNLYHEAIVRYYVFSVDPDLGAPYLAMEYVDGEPLADVLKRGPLDYDAVRVLQRRLAGGLQAAHELGIVHRDVSPDNIILPSGNVSRAKIIDFGIARTTLFGDATVIGGGFAGKFSYVSPEQLGLFGGEVTPKSDIYSLGLVLAEALTGRPLDMGGSQVEVVEKRRKVPDLRGVDGRMRPLLERMLQPKPGDRIGTMAEVAAWQPAVPPSAKRWPLIAGGLATAAALGAAAFLVVPRLGWLNGAPEQAQTAPDLAQAPPDSAPAERPQGPGPAPPTTLPSPPGVPADPAPPSSPGSVQEARRPEANPTERLARYIRDYEGGECFVLIPTQLESRSVAIEGFGSSSAAFEAFDEAFKRANGFEAQISLRLVTDTQCPAVRFIRRIGVEAERSPQLQIESFSLRDGEPLNGAVTNLGTRHVDVLLVSDDGYVYSLANYTKREGDAAKFTLRLKRPGGPRSKPQLVMAIASAQPLALLGAGKPVPADALFPLLLDEARTSGLTLDIAVKYFRLEG
jgi:eukaryotic-like serine/threonine-protein kinase